MAKKYKYHPCSKEFQDEAKKLGLTGNQYHQKLVDEGKLLNPTDNKVKDISAKRLKNGLKDELYNYGHQHMSMG